MSASDRYVPLDLVSASDADAGAAAGAGLLETRLGRAL